MSLQPKPSLTAKDYLVWERRQETRHEFLDGEIFAMTGASREHNLVCLQYRRQSAYPTARETLRGL